MRLNSFTSNQKSKSTNGRFCSGIEKKLEKYGIAAGALLMATATAKAQSIDYSGPVDEVIQNGQSLSFALNGTNTDFTLNTYAYNYYGNNYNYNHAGETYLTANNGGIDSSIPLGAGALIGPSSSFSSGVTFDYAQVYAYTQQYTYACGYKNEYTCVGTSYYGPYYSGNNTLPNNNSPQIIGLEFTASGKNYYEWAEIGSQVGYGSAEAELYDYAYNSAPFQSINEIGRASCRERV